MQERTTLCVAYVGEAVNGAMDVNELAPSLLALSNLVSEANQILNNDGSKIAVRISSHFERGSFELSLELVRNLPAQIKFLLFDSSYSLNEILNAVGLFCTISGGSLFALYKFIKGRKVTKVEKTDKDTVRIFVEEESREFFIGSWKLFQSQNVRRHVDGLIHPLKTDGINDLEFRDADNKQVLEKISTDETEYFSSEVQEELKEFVSSQKLMLRILRVSFDRDLKWRFDDGESQFYADIKDEEFWAAVEARQITFGCGDTIIAEIETTQQYVKDDLKKSSKTVTKVLRINKPE